MEGKIESRLLILDFDCKPEEISKALDLKPTQIVLKGDVKREDPEGLQPSVLHKRSAWVLRSDIPTNLSFDEHLELALKQLLPHAQAIAQVAGKYKAELSVFGFAQDADRIAVNLPRGRINELNELNVDLDIDIYPLAD